MNKLFYRTVFLLDYLPRYGRVWSMTEKGLASKPEWKWHSRGWWGLNLLDRLNLLGNALNTMYPESDHHVS